MTNDLKDFNSVRASDLEPALWTKEREDTYKRFTSDLAERMIINGDIPND